MRLPKGRKNRSFTSHYNAQAQVSDRVQRKLRISNEIIFGIKTSKERERFREIQSQPKMRASKTHNETF